MTNEDQMYFYRRAERELEMAQASVRTDVTLVHYELASRYLELVYGPDLRPGKMLRPN